MSTKIYNGFLIKNNPDIRTLNQYFIDLRKEIQEKGNQLFINLFIKKYCFFLDLYQVDKSAAITLYEEELKKTFSESDIKVHYYLYVLDKVNDAATKSVRYPSYDLSCSIHIIPIKEKILGLYYCEQTEYMDLIQNNEWFLEYHYQNQSDKPDKITEDEWDQREKDWNEALGISGIPNDQGFTIELFNTNRIPINIYQDIHPISNIYNRAKRVAEFLNKYDKFDGMNYSVFLSDDYKKFINKKAEEIIPLLKDNPFKKE